VQGEEKKAEMQYCIAFQPLLPDQDSNLDKLNQNQLYYHYTIGQPCQFLNWECKNRFSGDLSQMVFKKSENFDTKVFSRSGKPKDLLTNTSVRFE
jgi:hypothetical protein